jgi:hypothetical protein
VEFLRKYGVETTDEGAIFTLYVSDFDTEFATELGTDITSTRQEEISNYAQQRFPKLKIKTIKVVAGGILVCLFSFSNFSKSKQTGKTADSSQTAFLN